MAGSVNRVILIGRVGDDPDYHKFPSGGEMCTFSLATSETWRDQNGERREKTSWHKVKVTAEGLVKIVREYVRKGDLINVIGSIDYETWEKDGKKNYATKIAVKPIGGALNILSSKNGRGDGDSDAGGRRDDRRQDYGSQSRGGAPSQGARPGSGSTGVSRDLDDDIPFAPEWR